MVSKANIIRRCPNCGSKDLENYFDNLCKLGGATESYYLQMGTKTEKRNCNALECKRCGLLSLWRIALE